MLSGPLSPPLVVDGGDSLQLRSVTADILNKQSRRPIKGEPPPAWELGEGLTTPQRTKPTLLRNVSQGLECGRILWIW